MEPANSDEGKDMDGTDSTKTPSEKLFVMRRGVVMGPYFSYSQVETMYRRGIFSGEDKIMRGDEKDLGSFLDMFGPVAATTGVPVAPSEPMSLETAETVVGAFERGETLPVHSEEDESVPTKLTTRLGKMRMLVNEVPLTTKQMLPLFVDFVVRLVLFSTVLTGLMLVLKYLPPMLMAMVFASEVQTGWVGNLLAAYGYAWTVLGVVCGAMVAFLSLMATLKRNYGKFRIAVVEDKIDPSDSTSS